MHYLRKERDMLLQLTDWIVLPDSPISDLQRTNWHEYRQALRDLPSTENPSLDENGELLGVTWPTKPS